MTARLYALKTTTQRQNEVHKDLSRRHMTREEEKQEMEGFARFTRPWMIFLAAMILLGMVLGAYACDLGETDQTIKQIRAEAI